jgi:O-antigen ligase
MKSIAVDPLRVSSFMIFPMMLVAGLQQRAATPGARRIAGLLFWLGFVTCLLSFSRSSFLQILPALTVMWLLTSRHLRKLLLIVGAVLFALVAVAFMNPSNPLVKQYGLQRWAIAGKLASEHAEPREVIWAAALKAFEQNPLTGIGLNNFLPRYFEFRDPWLASGWIYWNQKATHSTYMEALVNTGVLGLTCCLLMMGYFVVLGWKVARQARADGDIARYLIVAAAVAAFAGQIVGGIALDLLSHNHVWIIMATLAVLDSHRPSQAGTAASLTVV